MLGAGFATVSHDTVETSTLHHDALRDLKSVNTNIVAAAAYPILEKSGELLPTRLRLDT
jgi:phosphate:Na+ symporter